MDVETKEILGAYVGSRSGKGAKHLYRRQCAVAYTDFWQAYGKVFPTKRYKAVGKEINYIERFNCRMRQRVARLVRKTLSFSKKLENHIGAIWSTTTLKFYLWQDHYFFSTTYLSIKSS